MSKAATNSWHIRRGVSQGRLKMPQMSEIRRLGWNSAPQLRTDHFVLRFIWIRSKFAWIVGSSEMSSTTFASPHTGNWDLAWDIRRGLAQVHRRPQSGSLWVELGGLMAMFEVVQRKQECGFPEYFLYLSRRSSIPTFLCIWAIRLWYWDHGMIADGRRISSSPSNKSNAIAENMPLNSCFSRTSDLHKRSRTRMGWVIVTDDCPEGQLWGRRLTKCGELDKYGKGNRDRSEWKQISVPNPKHEWKALARCGRNRA